MRSGLDTFRWVRRLKYLEALARSFLFGEGSGSDGCRRGGGEGVGGDG